METVNELLRRKSGSPIRVALPTDTVLEATQLMNEHGIGALLVMDLDRIVGIFTERDVLRRVVAAERIPSEVQVSEVMTTEVACCTPETPIDEARAILRQHRVRHLPVVSEWGDVVGLISIGDVNAHDANSREVTIHFLHEYLHGRV